MPFNFLAVIVASLVTLLVGFVWYNPKVFGTIWMQETGMTEEKAQKSNMLKIFGLTIFYSFLIALILPSLTIHQMGALGMIGGDPTLAKPTYSAFLADYGDAFRTFKHGALHGAIAGVFLLYPLLLSAVYLNKNLGNTLLSVLAIGSFH